MFTFLILGAILNAMILINASRSGKILFTGLPRREANPMLFRTYVVGGWILTAGLAIGLVIHAVSS